MEQKSKFFDHKSSSAMIEKPIFNSLRRANKAFTNSMLQKYFQNKQNLQGNIRLSDGFSYIKSFGNSQNTSDYIVNSIRNFQFCSEKIQFQKQQLINTFNHLFQKEQFCDQIQLSFLKIFFIFMNKRENQLQQFVTKLSLNQNDQNAKRINIDLTDVVNKYQQKIDSLTSELQKFKKEKSWKQQSQQIISQLTNLLSQNDLQHQTKIENMKEQVQKQIQLLRKSNDSNKQAYLNQVNNLKAKLQDKEENAIKDKIHALKLQKQDEHFLRLLFAQASFIQEKFE